MYRPDNESSAVKPPAQTADAPALTKAQLAEMLFDQIGLNKREAKDMVDAFFDLITEQLVNGADVKISGFGNFQIRHKAPRPGRNPRTGEPVAIEARRVVTFHASPKLKDQVQAVVANRADQPADPSAPHPPA